MSDYEDYESSQYDENWEFNSIINSLITKELDIRTKDVQDKLTSYKNNNTELKKTNIEKDNTIKELSKELSKIENKNGFFDDIINSINKDTVENFIKIIYKPDFNESAQFKDDAPVWFRLVINYYSNKDKIISFLRYCNINVPTKADTFRLPHEWNQEEIDVFFDTLHNHYVCNGCVYSENIGFWYREGYWDRPIDNCKHNYSEIPWQFILRNPILNSPEYCEKMANAINSNKGSNGHYFYKVSSYQKLDESNLKIFINNLNIPKENFNKDICDLLIKNIGILDKKQLEKIYPYIKCSYRAMDYIVKMPKEYLIKYLHEDSVDAKEIITKLNVLTKEEKLELLREFI